MDLQAFLSGLVAGSAEEVAAVAVTVALLVFGIIEFVDKKVRALASNTKFWAALVLSFVVPLGAYAGYQALWGGPIELNGLFLACSVGYAASQVVHKATELLAHKTVQKRMEHYVGKIPQGHDPRIGSYIVGETHPPEVFVPHPQRLAGYTPTMPIAPVQWQDESQDYFWTPEWQAAEREADEDIAAGRVSRMTLDDLGGTDMTNSGDVQEERGPS